MVKTRSMISSKSIDSDDPTLVITNLNGGAGAGAGAGAGDDDESSIVSQLTSCVKTSFVTTNNTWLDEKQDDIRRCLNGSATVGAEEEVVDLWQLRQLALTRGGLVSSQWRKRAWPKIVGAHQQILLQQNQQQQSSQQSEQMSVSNASMLLLKKDVSQTVWNVEDHVARQREEEHLNNASKVNYAQKEEGVPDLKQSHSTDTASPHTTKSPFFSVDGTTKNKEQEQQENDDMGSVGTNSPTTTLGTADTYSTSSVKRRTASKNEQKVLFNIIISVLRLPPHDCPYFEDDRYKYYKGLTDMAALMLIHLESPSLTSLLLGKLATHHLRDAMRNTNASNRSTAKPENQLLQTAVQLTLVPLLQQVDEELHAKLFSTSTQSVVACVVPWIQNWFCQQFTDVAMASRLMDVFLVSHAMMPVYVCAAFLCHPFNRAKIMAVDGDATDNKDNNKALNSVIRLLPLQFMKQQQDFINETDSGQPILSHAAALEDMIETALSFMEQQGPLELLALSSSKEVIAKNDKIASTSMIAMLQALPEWATVDSAPTDYALLQQAKAMRDKNRDIKIYNDSDESDNGVAKIQQCPQVLHRLYPKAMVATGGGVASRTQSKSNSRLLALLIMLLMVAAGAFVVTRTPAAVTPVNEPLQINNATAPSTNVTDHIKSTATQGQQPPSSMKNAARDNAKNKLAATSRDGNKNGKPKPVAGDAMPEKSETTGPAKTQSTDFDASVKPVQTKEKKAKPVDTKPLKTAEEKPLKTASTVKDHMSNSPSGSRPAKNIPVEPTKPTAAAKQEQQSSPLAASSSRTDNGGAKDAASSSKPAAVSIKKITKPEVASTPFLSSFTGMTQPAVPTVVPAPLPKEEPVIEEEEVTADELPPPKTSMGAPKRPGLMGKLRRKYHGVKKAVQNFFSTYIYRRVSVSF